jgi:hypothetical protein
MSYQYFGVFCSGKFMALWDAPATYGPTYGVPVTELNAPIIIRNCPGCQKYHVFQREDLKLSTAVAQQLPLRDFEEQDEE